MSGPILYTAETEYPVEHRGQFLQWYAYRHAPDIYQVGFHSCASYRAIEGGLNILGIYEIPGPELFDSPGYRAIQPHDPYRAAMAARTTERAHTVYAQRQLHPVETRDDMPALNADWLSMIRFAASEATEAEILRWFPTGAGAGLVEQGARRFRIAHRSAERPGSVTSRPRCLIVGEWPDRPPPGAEAWRDLTAHFGDALGEIDYYTGYRIYPWPDKPQGVPA